jgi:hypothetical protein
MRMTKTNWIIAGVVALLLVWWFTKEQFTAGESCKPATPCPEGKTAKTKPDGKCECA